MTRDERRVTSQRSVKRLDNRLGVNLETKSNLGFDSTKYMAYIHHRAKGIPY